MSHDPVTVNTRDGRCWRRRGWTPSGHGLYALEGSAQDAEQTLYLIGDLAEFGLRSMAYSVLPPVWDQVRAQALREGEHYAVTHHDYRTGRDLPKPDGAS